MADNVYEKDGATPIDLTLQNKADTDLATDLTPCQFGVGTTTKKPYITDHLGAIHKILYDASAVGTNLPAKSVLVIDSNGNAKALENWKIYAGGEFGDWLVFENAAGGSVSYMRQDGGMYLNSDIQATGFSGSSVSAYDKIQIPVVETPPAFGATGSAGEMKCDDNYLYVKTSTMWKRIALEDYSA